MVYTESVRGTGRWLRCALMLGLAAGASLCAAEAEEASTAVSVQDHMDVGLEYTLTVDGTVVDSTEGKPTFHYRQGERQIVPGLERQLAGLHVGDKKHVTVTPEEGYGQVDATKHIEVPRAQLPKEMTPQVGLALRGVNPDGKAFRAIIDEVKPESVVLNLNHPLAGKTLEFDITVKTIAPASASTPQ